MGFWDRYVVPPLISCACSSKPIMKQREKIVPEAEGVVLELGCGSGTNFGYYDLDKVTRLHALEPAEGMLRRAAQALEAQDLSGLAERTQFHAAGAEDVPLEDASVDTVMITFVLCTIPKWRQALEEARRVLKPGGRVLFSEHGLAPDPDVARWQHRVEPVWKRLAGGCHLTRSTPDMLDTCGFRVGQQDAMYLPGTPRIAGYAVWGSARVA